MGKNANLSTNRVLRDDLHHDLSFGSPRLARYMWTRVLAIERRKNIWIRSRRSWESSKALFRTFLQWPKITVFRWYLGNRSPDQSELSTEMKISKLEISCKRRDLDPSNRCRETSKALVGTSCISLGSSESLVSAHNIIICSVLFSLFAFEELGVKVQEKSAEHGAEIFTPLFLHF